MHEVEHFTGIFKPKTYVSIRNTNKTRWLFISDGHDAVSDLIKATSFIQGAHNLECFSP